MKIWDVIYYVVLEMPQILVILNVIFGYEIVKSKKRWIWISVCTTLIMILNQAIDNYALAVNTSMIISLFFVAFCMQGQKKFKIIKTVLVYFAVSTLNVAIRAVIALISENFDIVADLLCVLLVFVSMYIYRKVNGKKIYSGRNKLIMIMAGSLLVIGTTAIAVPLSNGRMDNPQYVIVFAIACILTILASIMLVFFSIQNDEYKIREKVNKEREKLLSDYFNDVKENNIEMRRFRHDYKKHIRGMKYLIANEKYEELNEYIKALDDSEWINTKIIDAGNEFVSAILNDYMRKANSLGITMDIAGIVPVDGDIADIDWSTILSNSLSNAIEAVKGVEEKNRFVKVEFKVWDNKLVIEMRNYYNQPIKMINGNIKTTKKDTENHGYGIRNIQDVVEKYHGNLSYEVNEEKKIFNLRIIVCYKK